MCAAIPVLLLYAFLVWTRTNFNLLIVHNFQINNLLLTFVTVKCQSLSGVLMFRQKNDVLHPLMAGNGGHADENNVYSNFKILNHAVQ